MACVEIVRVRVRVMGSSVFSVNGRDRSRLILPRLLLAGVSAALLAACSSDVSRFAESPFGVSDRNPTGSTPSANAWLPPADVGGAAPAPMASALPAAQSPAPAVQSMPLPPPAMPAQPNPGFAAPATPSPRLTSATPAAASAIPTGTARNLATSGNWSAEGGTPIVVAQGESVNMLSARYGVPTTALLAVNGMTSPAQVQPGARMIIPVYNATRPATRPATGAAATAPAPTARPAAAAPPTPAARPERLRLARGPEPVSRTPATSNAPANNPQAKNPQAKNTQSKNTQSKNTQSKNTQTASARAAESAPRTSAAPQSEAPARSAAAPAAPASPQNSARPVKQAALEQPRREAPPAASSPASDDAPTGSVPSAAEVSKPEFRWPARGRIIQGYKKGAHDGINIAVPEGTPVKAAESGVVAYAGNELKGYGNLVLIRHPNGYVSAYAHNGELNVKRGEQIRRGQVIARSGKTGNVASPQLHFELRKGSTPVDPTEYLAGM